MQAIKSIAEDKLALCQRHGVPYDPADWPAHGVFPKEFIADRGSDVLSDNSTLLVDGLEIGVRNLPARRADHKPLVECGFKLLQRSMADALLVMLRRSISASVRASIMKWMPAST